MTLTHDQRFQIADRLAQRWLDNMSTKDLERYFYDTQLEYLQTYDDQELLSELTDVVDDEELDDIVNSAA